MRKSFLLLAFLAFVAIFISSCSQEYVVNNTKASSLESLNPSLTGKIIFHKFSVYFEGF